MADSALFGPAPIRASGYPLVAALALAAAALLALALVEPFAHTPVAGTSPRYASSDRVACCLLPSPPLLS